jgi:hypothetical protein
MRRSDSGATRLPAVLVVAHSAEGHSRAINGLSFRPVFNGIGEILFTLPHGQDIHTPRENATQHSELCAVILMLDPVALEGPSVALWVEWCRQQICAQDVFRIYVQLFELTLVELRQHAGRFGWLADLLDLAQIDESVVSFEGIAKSLHEYLPGVPNLRRANRWKRWTTQLSISSGILVTGAPTAAQVAVWFVVFWGGLHGRESLAREFSPLQRELLAVVCGVFFCSQFLSLLFATLRPQRIGEILRRNQAYRYWWNYYSWLVPCLTIGSLYMLRASLSSFAAGAALGLILEATRRNGLRAWRCRIALWNQLATAKGRSLPIRLEETIAGIPPNPGRIPLVPVTRTNIFISYAVASDWCRALAGDLFQALDRRELDVFLDSKEIGPGANWPRVISERLANANVVVVLADGISIEREWVASELEAALYGRSYAREPELVILLHPELCERYSASAYPVFQALLRDLAPKPGNIGFGAAMLPAMGRPRVVVVKPDTVRILTADLRHFRFEDASIFPPIWRIPFHLMAKVIVFSSGLLLAIGPFGLVAGLTNCMGSWTARPFFATHGMQQFAFQISAMGFGLCFLALVAALFLMSGTRGRVIGSAAFLALSGWGCILFLSYPQLSVTAYAWASMALWLGGFGALMLSEVSYGKAQARRTS